MRYVHLARGTLVRPGNAGGTLLGADTIGSQRKQKAEVGCPHREVRSFDRSAVDADEGAVGARDSLILRAWIPVPAPAFSRQLLDFGWSLR